MLIYLDNCTFNRPFDNQKQGRIYLETVCKLKIQDAIAKKLFELAWSYILDYENSANPFAEKSDAISGWKKYASVDIGETEQILLNANKLSELNIKPKDGLHIASAIEMNCDFFITTDRALIKKCCEFRQLVVLNPIDFVDKINF